MTLLNFNLFICKSQSKEFITIIMKEFPTSKLRDQNIFKNYTGNVYNDVSGVLRNVFIDNYIGVWKLYIAIINLCLRVKKSLRYTIYSITPAILTVINAIFCFCY